MVWCTRENVFKGMIFLLEKAAETLALQACVHTAIGQVWKNKKLQAEHKP